MAIGWFLVPYKRITPYTGPGFAGRYCAMLDFSADIKADGGAWRETEVLDTSTPPNGGTAGMALVKVRASAATLTTIGAADGNMRILAKVALTDTLSDLTSTQRNAILNRLQALGYTLAEISDALGGNLANWRTRTFGQLLRFVARRRLKPRYDSGTDAVICDGVEVAPLPVDTVDAEVSA